MPTEILSTLDYIQRGGSLLLVLLILYGGYRKWWVFGWSYEEKINSEREWRVNSESLRRMMDSLINERREHYLVAHDGNDVPKL